MITTDDLKISKIRAHLKIITDGDWKDQSIKNKIHTYKKDKDYRNYLALKCAYEILKLNRAS